MGAAGIRPVPNRLMARAALQAAGFGTLGGKTLAAQQLNDATMNATMIGRKRAAKLLALEAAFVVGSRGIAVHNCPERVEAMLAAQRVVLSAVAMLLAPAGLASGDCCAGSHAHYLAYGSQFGYGGGVARGRSAQPFVGVANPRYATTLQIGGPLATTGQSPSFGRRAFVNTPQMEAVAARAAARSVDYASDVDLLEQPTDADEPSAADAPPDTFTPEYPGQAYGKFAVRAHAIGSAVSSHPPSGEGPPKHRQLRAEARLPARAATSRRKATAASRSSRPAAGAYASESATRIARSLRASGLDF